MVDDVHQAQVLVHAFESFAISQADIGTFEQANTLARELRHNELTVDERSAKSDALFGALGTIWKLLPPEQGPVFHKAFQQYHDLMLVFPTAETAFHTRQFHPNPDAAEPGRANFIASILREAPSAPGVAVDLEQLSALTQQAITRGKLDPALATALIAANNAAEALNAPYYLGSDMLAQGMHSTANLMRERNIAQGVEDTQAMAKWHEDMAAWDRSERPGQTQALDAALADIRRLIPGDKTEAYLTDFMQHYALQYRMNIEHPEQMEYLPSQGGQRQPGAFLPLDIAKAGRDTGAAR